MPLGCAGSVDLVGIGAIDAADLPLTGSALRILVHPAGAAAAAEVVRARGGEVLIEAGTLPAGVWEALRGVQVRAVAAMDELVADHPKDCIAVVSHADVIKMIVAFYLGVALDLYQRIIISTASVSELALVSGEVRVLCINQTMTAPGGE